MRKLLLALFFAALVHGQETGSGPPQLTVRASGEGIVTVPPDQVVLNIGVTNQAPAAETAAAQNARQMTTVLDALKAAVGSAGEIKTVGYSLTPNYKYPRNETPVISGYTASNTVQVRLYELDKIGAVIDAAARVGANAVGGMQYSLRDEERVRKQALEQAARSARDSAQAIAASLGMRVMRVRSAESALTQPPRLMMAMGAQMMERSAAPTPIEAGTIEIRATVTVTLDIAP